MEGYLCRLYSDEFSNTRLPSQSFPEQQDTEDLDQAVTTGAKLVNKLTVAKIELIEEYRTRLIADVVTGKLDVRNAI